MGKRRTWGWMPVIVAVLMVLGGCGPKLPADAQQLVLSGFDPDQEAQVLDARQTDLLPEDVAMGAEEVWCVNVSFACWSCDYGEFRTCADSRLVRRIDGEWQVFLVLTDEDKAQYEARGCELTLDAVAR